MLLTFGHLIAPFWGPDDVTKRKIPEETFPTNYDKLKDMPSDLEAANLDAYLFNLVVKKSTISNAGMGLFAKIGMLKGTTIGYYWGKIFVADRLEAKVLNDRILQLHKYVSGEDGQKRSLFIVACRKCAAGYANDPRTIGKPANAYFEEYGSLDLGYQMVALILLDAVEAGEEIFADYGPMYHITSTPMSLITDGTSAVACNSNATPAEVATCEATDVASKQVSLVVRVVIGRDT